MAEMQPGSCQPRNSAHSLRLPVHREVHFPLPKHPYPIGEHPVLIIPVKDQQRGMVTPILQMEKLRPETTQQVTV